MNCQAYLAQLYNAATSNIPNTRHCGIFVRNEKRVQFHYTTTANPHAISGPTFKTFGKAIKIAYKMGFTTYETDDGNILPITKHAVEIANR